MTEPVSRLRSTSTTVILLCTFLALDVRVAVYHLATEGRKSGTVEIALVPLAIVLTFAVIPASARRTSSGNW